ncbi:MAG: AAA family ATPase [Candidatus Diapherotrites archaeon]|jgi:DNA repair protein SbcC/Rad50|uniref:AAA family ATPase n=1 Tax=Candidatus Iainarchaeum sp. TaxID=3101447 RepID=A0A8T5GH50_9ARCH|nr:AAA family ATPase [Candidatus Diapherotrites archaeon]
MIEKLELTNWRTHKESSLEFGKGTNVIVGVMGSGKSSLVNALSYSLFGTFPALKSKQVSLKEIIMNRPNQCDISETKVEFSHGEKKYVVERKIKFEGTNEAKMFCNEKLMAGPKQKDVNEKVEHILGLSYELFSRAVYAEQNEMDFFLRLSPGDRKKKFDELLELSRYEEARKNAISLQNQLLKDNIQRQNFIQHQKENIKSQEKSKILKQLEDGEKELIELEKEILNSTKNLKECEEKYKKLEEKEGKSKKLQEEIIRGKSQIEGLKKDLEKSKVLSLDEIKIALDLKKNEVKTKKGELEKEEMKEASIIEEEKKLKEKISVFEYQKKENEKEITSTSKLEGKCPTCKQELDLKHKEKLQNEIKEKIATIKSELEKENKETHKLLDTRVKITQKIKEIKGILEKKVKEQYKLEAMIKEAQQIDGKKKELGELEESIPKIEKELIENGFDKKELENAREKYFDTKSKKELNDEKIKSKKELNKSYKETLGKIEKIQKDIKNMEEEHEQNELAAKKAGMFNNCLIATQQELREAMLETINSAMTNIWEAIYPYKDYLDARLCVVENGYDLQVQTRSNGWVRVEGILSGGERSAAALCIRIAFALVLTKQLSMLILDEPTHNLDSNAVEKLSEMLREEIPNLVEQTFVITHDKELENAASSNLYLLNRNKDTDEPTKIEIKPIV